MRCRWIARAGLLGLTLVLLNCGADRRPLPCWADEECANGVCIEGVCIEVQSCAELICENGGECDDRSGVPVCRCATGYDGERCTRCAEGYVFWPESSSTCVDDPCSPPPCDLPNALDDGCVQIGLDDYICLCQDGYLWREGGCVQDCDDPDTPEVEQCECPTGDLDSDLDGVPDCHDCDEQDPSIFPGAADLPDPDAVDSNCDGIDGDASRSVFVAWDVGVDLDNQIGDRDHPFATIQAAVDFAEADLEAGGRRSDVLISAGDYREAIRMTDGVNLYGGYQRAMDWARLNDGQTRITAPQISPGEDLIGVDAVALARPVELMFLTIRTEDAQDGASCYGVRLYDNASPVRISHCSIEPGTGGSRPAAAPAGGDGASGGAGASGSTGCSGCSGGGDGGSGGSSPCGSRGGTGGSGGYGYSSGSSGSSGQGPAGGYGGSGGYGDDSVCAFGCDNAGSGSSGGSGSGGAQDGAAGAPGDMAGFVDQGRWFGGLGAQGAEGGHGSGGGGGGGGGGTDCCDDDRGGGGGGGGGGGCGGQGGAGGLGGGASLGVFVVDADAVVERCSIHSADGGRGQDGGPGGVGGRGGSGGSGGYGPDDAGSGGRGGSGSSGSAGGSGGGGGGGVSFAVYMTGSCLVDLIENELSCSAGGLGGSGGEGGAQGDSGDLFTGETAGY